MKNTLIYSAFIIAAVTVIPSADALTVTPTSKLSPTKVSTPSPTLKVTKANEVQQLREKVAAKVSELKKKNHKPFSGEIITLSDNTLTIQNEDNVEMEVKIDSTLTSLYKIAGASAKEIEKDDLEKGQYIIVTGPVLDKTITANLIYVDEPFIVGSGKITEVDSANYFIKVISQDKTTYTLDIDTKTQSRLLDIKTLESGKIGFSKLKEGDLVHFVAKKPSEKNVSRLPAQKILVIPQEYFNK